MKKRILATVFRLCGPRYRLYSLCRSYVNWYRGEGYYEPDKSGELRVIQHLVPELQMIFDVGAHRGEWTRDALQYSSSAQYHLFEPALDSHQRIVEAGFPETVIANRCGLSNRCCQQTLYKSRKHPSTNALHAGQHSANDSAEQEQVELITLDAYCKEKRISHIDYLKVDVEGHELRVLEGARAMLQSGSIRFIQFEYNQCAIFEGVFLRNFFEFLGQYGYHFYKIVPRGLVQVEHWHSSLETFTQSNYLAAKIAVPDGLVCGEVDFPFGAARFRYW